MLGRFAGGNDQSNTGAAACDTNGCTYTSFMGGAPLTEFFTLDGTIAKSGDTLTFDLTYSFGGKLGSGAWTLDGALTAGPTAVDGSLHGHGYGGAGAYDRDVDVTWDVDVEPANIELDGTGCPIGGSIDATASYHDRDNGVPMGTSPSYDVEGHLSFGPSCV